MGKVIKTESLCYGNSCCPDVKIYEDGTVELTEGTFSIKLSKESADILVNVLTKTGHGS